MTGKFLEGALEARPRKPRKVGLTQAVDKFEGLAREEFAWLSDAVDLVKIRWGLPLLVEEEVLRRRIKFYHEHHVKVSTGGTLTELMLRAGRFRDYLKAAARVGFDHVEVSEGGLPLADPRYAEMAAQVKAAGLGFLAKVGRKDPRHPLAPRELERAVERGLEAGSPFVVLEAAEGHGVGIYRADGSPDMDLVDHLGDRFGARQLLFEAPLEAQQAAMILHLGPDVNLGAVETRQLASLESMRVGVRAGATFGLTRRARRVTGSPAVKFVYHLVASEPLVDQTRLCQASGLPRRTVQHALEALKRQGLVAEAVSLEDPRRKVYRSR